MSERLKLRTNAVSNTTRSIAAVLALWGMPLLGGCNGKEILTVSVTQKDGTVFRAGEIFVHPSRSTQSVFREFTVPKYTLFNVGKEDFCKLGHDGFFVEGGNRSFTVESGRYTPDGFRAEASISVDCNARQMRNGTTGEPKHQ